MLSLRLRLDDLSSSSWTWIGERWTTGDSWLVPFTGRAVASQLVRDPTGQVALAIQERTDPPSTHGHDRHHVEVVADIDTVISRARTGVGDYLTVRLAPGRVDVAAGPGGVAPLYLVAGDGLLLGSWHLPDLGPLVRPDRLLDRAVVRRLTRQARYTSDTVLFDVHRLTERATATFTRAGLLLSYPDPAEHVLRPRHLRADVDVVTAFTDLLADIVSRAPAGQDGVGVELSGGADSANVALTLAHLHGHPVRSYGLLLDGVVGDQQRRRRAAMVERFGLRDATVDASDHPPFVPTGVRGQEVPHDPTSAYYREAFDALRDAVVAGGTRIMCTGLGGDELMARHRHEQTTDSPTLDTVPWLGPAARAALDDVDVNVAPAAPVPVTVLMAQASHNPAYLSAGIWPVALLAHPALVRWCEQLPLTWRLRKRLLRERLRRGGLARDVVDPPLPETFTGLMQAGLRSYGLSVLKGMLAESRLVDLGYLDHAALRDAYEDALTSATIRSILCDALSLEIGLRSLDRAGCPS